MDETTDQDTELDEIHPEDVALDPRVTSELFLEWRSPRFGAANPERMNNPVWEWLIVSKLSAYWANHRLQGPSSLEAGPCWCFNRYGQTSTTQADGRIVLIGGEHEDYYDPDFCIYNDVVVLHADGRVDIYGYPREVFPPTDFHSATRIGQQIVIIGNLGYVDQRKPGVTEVRILDLETFAISDQPTTGAFPGWINDHQAELAGDGSSILIKGGFDHNMVENIDDWSLSLVDWRWTQLTDRQWPRWEVRRADLRRNHLFDYGQEIWARDNPKWATPSSPPLAETIGTKPNLELFERLYSPPIPHVTIPAADDGFRVRRLQVDGVTIRYDDDGSSIHLTIEGSLPVATMAKLTTDLIEKFSALENAPCELVSLSNK